MIDSLGSAYEKGLRKLHESNVRAGSLEGGPGSGRHKGDEYADQNARYKKALDAGKSLAKAFSDSAGRTPGAKVGGKTFKRPDRRPTGADIAQQRNDKARAKDITRRDSWYLG